MSEKTITSISGYTFLLIASGCAGLGIYLFTQRNALAGPGSFIVPIVLLLTAVFIFKGLCIIYPNQGVAATFFGSYVGTLKDTGLLWINPLYKAEGISLRARELGFRLEVFSLPEYGGQTARLEFKLVDMQADPEQVASGRAPASAQSSTLRDWPGSKRTAVPAGMFKR